MELADEWGTRTRIARYGRYEVWDCSVPHVTDEEGAVIVPSAELMGALEMASKFSRLAGRRGAPDGSE